MVKRESISVRSNRRLKALVGVLNWQEKGAFFATFPHAAAHRSSFLMTPLYVSLQTVFDVHNLPLRIGSVFPPLLSLQDVAISQKKKVF